MTHHLHRNVHRFRPEAEDVRDEPNLLRIIEDVSQVIISLNKNLAENTKQLTFQGIVLFFKILASKISIDQKLSQN